MSGNDKTEKDKTEKTGVHVRSRRWRNRTIKRVSLIAVLVMAVLSIAIYYTVGSINISSEGAISVAMSVSGLLLTAALFALTTVDHRGISHTDRYFLITLLLLSFSLFFIELSWFAEGRNGLVWAVYLTETLLVVCGMGMILSFYKYLLHTVFADRKDKLRVLSMIISLFAGFAVLMAVLNPLTGLIFTVDADGYEVDGIFVFLRKMEMLYPFWLLAVVWVFISVYDGYRRIFESKKHDTEIADSVLRGILPSEDEDLAMTAEMKALADSHTIPDAMKLAELLTRERVHRIEKKG